MASLGFLWSSNTFFFKHLSIIDSLHHFGKLSSTFLNWESFSSLSLRMHSIPHTLLSLFLLLLCLLNVHPPLQYTLTHLNIHAHTHIHTLMHTDHSVPPACQSVTDWLLPRRLGFVDVRNRTGIPDHRGHKEDWCLLSQPPFSLFHFLSPSEPLTLPHMHTHWHPLTL